MNRKRRKTSSDKKAIKKNKIIRCKSKMIPVFDNENCKDFIKKENSESSNFCKNCKHSF